MPRNWSDWAHVMCSTRGHWLPGDPRGFRDHDHRIHSSGDYKNPPSPSEHRPLHNYAKSINQKVIVFAVPIRERIGLALLHKFDEMKVAVRVLSVSGAHTHALIRVGRQDAKELFGRAKQYASHQVREELPGTIWGEGSHPVRIREEEHYRNVVTYILDHKDEGAWTWENPSVKRPPEPGASQSLSPGV